MKNNYFINKIGLNSKTLIFIFVILLASLSTQQIQAQLFDSLEMEGNALDEAPIENDAENLYTGGFNTTVFGNNYIDFTFIADGNNSSTDDIAFGGGSKDVLDIDSWEHSIGGAPDKNQLMNGMGATFVDKNTGHPMLYIGVDRYDAAGNASMGFWFLGQKIAMQTGGALDGKYVNTETGALATHVDGDVLVVADFNGSGTPTIRVLAWDPTQANNLLLLTSGNNDCAIALNGDAFCASANSTTYAAPWPYINKNPGDANHIPGVFLEALVDLEALLGPNLACFNTFLVESRSSNLVNAQQKDVAIGALTGCDLTINKTGATLSKEGDKVTYQFEITNPAVIPLTVDSLIDDVLGDITSEVIADGGLIIRGQKSVFVDYDWTVPAGTFLGNNPLTNTATLTYTAPNGVSTPDTVVSDTHTLELFNPSVTLEKTAVVDGATATTAVTGDVVTYNFTITNTTQDSPNLGAPDLVLSTSYSNTPAIIGQEYEDVAGNSTFTGFDVFVGDAGATEGNNLVFDVVLSSAAAGDVTVNVSTTNGTAISGADFTGGAYSVVIPAGSTAGTITIPTLVNAPLTESNETFTVAITSVSSTSGTDTFDDTSDTGTGTVIEAGHVFDDILGDITADASACGTIASGASCTFTVDHTVVLADSDPLVNNVDVLMHPEGFPNDIAATDSYSLDILPIISINSVSLAEGDAGTTAFTFTVTLDRPNDTDITLDYATVAGTATAGTDFTALSVAGYNITAGTTTFDITVDVLTDLIDEADEAFLLTLSNLSANAEFVADAATISGTGSILNDDINAVNDDFTSNPINATGGIAGDVTLNDTLDTVLVTDADITISVTNTGGLTGVTIDATGNIIVLAGSAAGTYSVTYQICENGAVPANCDAAIATVVIVPDPPTAASPAPYCDGDTIADITATGVSSAIFTWYSDSGLTTEITVDVSGTNNETFSPSGAVGTQTVYVTQKIGATGIESASTTVNITVNPTPDISTADTPSICEGSSFDLSTLTIVDANSTTPTYTYHSATPAVSGNELSSSTVSPTADTTYYVLATTANGCEDELAITVSVIDEADLSLTKTVNDSTPSIGDTIIYTITVTNSGPCDVTGITVQDILPTGVTYNAGASTIPTTPATTTFSVSGTTGTWDLSGVTLNDTESIELKIAVDIGPNCGTLVNSAQIMTSSRSVDSDSTPGNGQ